MSDAEHSPIERAKRRIGTTLKGKYRLDRILGIGGMAVVYGARHRNGNPVAVKVLFPELSIEPGMRARFLREGYVANAVEHRGAVRVLDDDVAEDGSVFLVMELLEGQSLDARWEACRRRMAPREVMVHLHQVLDVLAAAHAKGITHRDVKPDNLFLVNDGSAKILDFGIARLRETAGASATRSGTLFGTPAFMAPEQALGRVKEVDAQSDVYAVGATAFTLISGRYVHAAETAEEMMVFAATQPAPSLATVAPTSPEALVAIVDRALAFARPERWPNARAMQQAVAEAFQQIFGEPIPSVWRAPDDAPIEHPRADADAGASEGPTVAIGDAVTLEGKTVPRARPLSPRSTIAGVAAAAFLLVLFGGAVIAFVTSRSTSPAFNVSSIGAPAATIAASVSSDAPAPEPLPSAAATPSTSSISIDALPKASASATPGARPSKYPAPAPTKRPKRDPLAP